MAKQHTEEFKQEAVRIALTSGLSRRQVAEDLGVGFSTLARWIQRSRPDDLPPTEDIDLAKENERLRKENWTCITLVPLCCLHYAAGFQI